MFNVGRVCMKIAGRDAGKFCVVIQEEKAPYVLVDGQTRRKRCNVNHLEPLTIEVQVGKNASRDDILAALKDAGLPVDATPKKRQKAKKTASAKPTVQRGTKKESKK